MAPMYKTMGKYYKTRKGFKSPQVALSESHLTLCCTIPCSMRLAYLTIPIPCYKQLLLRLDMRKGQIGMGTYGLGQALHDRNKKQDDESRALKIKEFKERSRAKKEAEEDPTETEQSLMAQRDPSPPNL